MAPRRPVRGVAPSAAIGLQFSSSAVDRAARRSLRDLLDAARALSSSPAGSPLRPGDQLRAAVEAFKALELGGLGVEKPAVLRLLWEPAEARAALLGLHAQLLRVLASPTALAAMGTSERARHLDLLAPCCNTLSALLQTYSERADNEEEEEPEEAAQAASVALALRTDLLPASCTLLAAGRQDPRLLLPIYERTTLALMLYRTFSWSTQHLSLHSASAAAERYGRHVRQAHDGQGIQQLVPAPLDAGGLLVALARCRGGEHLACIMFEAGLEVAAAAVAAAAGRGAAAPQRAKPKLLASQADAVRAQLLAVPYFLECFQTFQDSEAADTAAGAASCSSSVTSESCVAETGVRLRQEEGQQHTASAAAAATRAIMSGPCLQYALAAHVVAQLAAADGGTRYGLAEEQTLLPDYAMIATADTRPARQQPTPPAPHFLCASGLISVLRVWTRCRLQSPPVPLAPVSCSGVRTLALRLARVAVHSAAHHMAMRQQPQQRRPQQLSRPPQRFSEAPEGSGGGGSAGDSAPAGPASGDGGPSAPGTGPAATSPAQQALNLYIPVGEAGFKQLAFEALQCAALTMRRPPVLYGGTLPPAGGEDGAADAAAAEWWGMAVQAVRQALWWCVEDDRVADLSTELLPEHALRALTAHVPHWPAGDLPHPPPPNLAVALSAGCLPLLERAMRTLQHSHEARAMPAAATSGTAHLALLLEPACAWPLLGRLMAYGEPRQVAALLATSAKLIGRLSEGLREEQAAALSRSILAGGRAAPAVGDSKVKDTSSSASEGVSEVLCELPLPDMLRWLAAAVERQQQDGFPSAGDEQAAAEAAAAGSAAGAAAAESSGVSTAAALPPAGQVGLENAVGQGCPPARALMVSPLQVPGPSRQLAPMIVFAARRWLPALSRLAMADGSTLAVGAPGASGPAGLAAAGLVLPWVPALVHAAVQQKGGEQRRGAVAAAPSAADAASGVSASTPAACVSPAASPLLLLADVDVVGLLGRTLQGLEVPGGAEGAAGGGAAPLFEAGAEALHAACAALECVAAAFPGEVAVALVDGRLPPLHRAPEALLCGVAGARLLPEQRQQRERLLLLLSALGDGTAAETTAGTSAPTSAAPLPDPCVSGEGTAPASKVGAWLAAAAVAAADGTWDALLPTCSNPLCASLAGGSEADLTLRACGGCGRPRYCCPDCQRAHWRAGHKGECALRQGSRGGSCA